jgi:hypothetical protein
MDDCSKRDGDFVEGSQRRTTSRRQKRVNNGENDRATNTTNVGKKFQRRRQRRISQQENLNVEVRFTESR